MFVNNNMLTEEQYEKIEEIIIDIDMLVGFLEKGALAAPSIMRIVPYHEQLLEENENKDNAINVFGHDYHPKDATEFLDYPPHAVIDTPEVEIISQLYPFMKRGLEFKKNSTDLCQVEEFREFLRKAVNLKKVTVIGCLSEVCVSDACKSLIKFFQQYNRQVMVCVVFEAIDTFDAPGHNASEVNEGAIKNLENAGVKILRRTRGKGTV